MGSNTSMYMEDSNSSNNKSSESGGSNPRSKAKANPKRRYAASMEELKGSASRKSVLGVPTEDIRAIYDLGRELGKGQFGVTRLCTHKASGKRFACKTISKRRFACKEDADDVRTEVHVLRTVSGSSPNIIRFEDAFEDSRSVHLVMQFCSGGELFDRIVSRGSYSELAASSACSTIVGVLRTCHSLGVMHRDLKPENFLLLDPSDDAPLVAIDFGLSTFFQPGQVFRDLVGSAYYVAPEVLNRSYGPEADIWSAGVILYILLSGVPPFWGDTEEAIFDAIREDPLDLTSKPWPSISDSAKDLLQKMLTKNPKTRITIDEILSHPWIREAPDRPLDSAIVMRLKQFRAMNKLKKVALQLIAETLTEDEISGLKEMFQSMDVDKSGSLTIDELRHGLAKQGTILSQSEVQELLKAADTDGNGSIDYMEFVTATLRMGEKDDENQLLSAFKYFDKDNSGYITAEELAQALQKHGAGDEETIKDIIAEVDIDQDGCIDYDEFVAMMRESEL